MAERHLVAQACRAEELGAVFPICRLLLTANLSDDGSGKAKSARPHMERSLLRMPLDSVQNGIMGIVCHA
jgi:hypothetical protein